MCHAYSITTNVEAIRQMVQTIFRFEVAAKIGNLAPQTGVYPDMLAPTIRNQPGFRELIKVRWGMRRVTTPHHRRFQKIAYGMPAGLRAQRTAEPAGRLAQR